MVSRILIKRQVIVEKKDGSLPFARNISPLPIQDEPEDLGRLI